MKRWTLWMALAAVFGLAGCVRMQTRLLEMPRVDQELTGNQGYLVGKAKTAPGTSRKATRQIVMTDVELPTWQEMKAVGASVGSSNRGYVIPESPRISPEETSPSLSAPVFAREGMASVEAERQVQRGRRFIDGKEMRIARLLVQLVPAFEDPASAILLLRPEAVSRRQCSSEQGVRPVSRFQATRAREPRMSALLRHAAHRGGNPRRL